jgi:hypothetical protein
MTKKPFVLPKSLRGTIFDAVLTRMREPDSQRAHRQVRRVISRLPVETILEDLKAAQRADLGAIKGLPHAEQRRVMKEPDVAKRILNQMHNSSHDGAEPISEEPERAGQFRFSCGYRKKPTASQVELYESLRARQKPLAAAVQVAIREMHEKASRDVDLDDPCEQILFPADSALSDVALSCFRINYFHLSAGRRRIILTLDSILQPYKHVCGLLIEGGKVTDSGAGVLEKLEHDWE